MVLNGSKQKNTMMVLRIVLRCLLIVCAVFVIKPAIGNNFLSLLLGTKAEALANNRQDADREIVEIASRIRFKIYKSSSIEDVPVGENDLLYAGIDHTKALVLYLHGFREHPSNESIRTVVEVATRRDNSCGGDAITAFISAHLERGTDNVMLLDWSDLAFENYVTVAGRVRHIAMILARTFDDLVQLGLDLETFHIVGHSLGAQIGGLVGKYSRNSIPRITGLDPAKPGFYHPGAEHIDAGSARFVDVVHTDGGVYGALSETGTVDFFANGGSRPQPGCPLIGVPLTPSDLCNHWRSWRYYAESIANEFAFPALQCPSYREFVAGKCARNRRAYFGYASPTNIHGTFFFTTNDRAPFSNGSDFDPANLLE